MTLAVTALVLAVGGTVLTLTASTSPVSAATPDPTPPSANAVRKAAPRPAPRRAPRPRRAPTSDRVDHALAVAAATYGVPEAKLRRVATCESTLNPKARNGRYVGLFQFGLPLWRATPYGRFPRTDPYAAALAAAWAFKRGMARHWPVCGRK